MRRINYPMPTTLPARWTRLSTRRIAEMGVQANPVLRSTYIRNKPSWTTLKKWLSQLSHNKCWYCETNSSRAPLDVDHFRPKLEVTIDRKKLDTHTGYYWLAYEWSNFRLSCQRCNRPEKDNSGTLRGKANEFPVKDEGNRCVGIGGNLAVEDPRLMDPCSEKDCSLLAHGVDGEVKPSGSRGTWDHERATYTINLLGLNEFNAPENRRRKWQLISNLIQAYGDTPPAELRDQLQTYLLPAQEYLSFFRSAIGTHRDKNWIEALIQAN